MDFPVGEKIVSGDGGECSDSGDSSKLWFSKTVLASQDKWHEVQKLIWKWYQFDMIFFVVFEHKIPILAHYQFSNLVTWVWCHLLNEEMQIRETFPLKFYLYICIFIYLLYVCICVHSCVSVCMQYICRCVCLYVCIYITACIQIMSGNFQELVPFYLVGMYLCRSGPCVYWAQVVRFGTKFSCVFVPSYCLWWRYWMFLFA